MDVTNEFGLPYPEDTDANDAPSFLQALALRIETVLLGRFTQTTDARLANARPPNGGAGGVLAGAYPNPGFAATAVGTGGDQVARGDHLHDARYYTKAQIETLLDSVRHSVGEVSSFYGPKGSCPANWLIMDGSAFSAVEFPALVTFLGGSTTLPDFSDQVLIGASPTKPVRSAGGNASKSIGVANLPPHSHPVNDPGHQHQNGVHASGDEVGGQGLTTAPTFRDRVMVGGTGTTHGLTTPNGTGIGIGNTGGGVPLDIMPPWRALWPMIRAR